MCVSQLYFCHRLGSRLDYFSATGSPEDLRDVVESLLGIQRGVREDSLLIMTVCRALRRQTSTKGLLGLISLLPQT